MAEGVRYPIGLLIWLAVAVAAVFVAAVFVVAVAWIF